ncbi:hypothetical protein [Pallidibacillus thermolactis]|uniref:hypothetical protein n=1 Tax=Pallidibacillus thermolactis TaxID=251051 RepID=UPI002E1CB4C6|nr:hypothetical protein [Pallidibacillus thermolactis subsp. kokeshiiformis]
MIASKNKIFYKGVTYTLSTMLVVSLTLPSFGTKANAEVINLNSEQILNYQDEIDNLAADLEFLFTDATDLKDGKYVINEEVIIDKFGVDSLAPISAFIKMVNGEELTINDLKGVPNVESSTSNISGNFMMAAKQSWKQCVGEKIIDATGIGFISGGLWKLIEREAWKQVAIELAKIAGKNALKGGIIGLAASLAWYGIKCK